jgi:hypothetical protein
MHVGPADSKIFPSARPAAASGCTQIASIPGYSWLSWRTAAFAMKLPNGMTVLPDTRPGPAITAIR